MSFNNEFKLVESAARMRHFNDTFMRLLQEEWHPTIRIVLTLDAIGHRPVGVGYPKTMRHPILRDAATRAGLIAGVVVPPAFLRRYAAGGQRMWRATQYRMEQWAWLGVQGPTQVAIDKSRLLVWRAGMIETISPEFDPELEEFHEELNQWSVCAYRWAIAQTELSAELRRPEDRVGGVEIGEDPPLHMLEGAA